jgi:hypothetical protein
MHSKYVLLAGIFLIFLSFFGCSQKNVEALEDDISQTELEFKEKLDALIQRKNSLQVVGRALTVREQQFVGKVDKLEGDYQVWRSADYPETRRSYVTRLEGLQALQKRAKELMELEKPEVDLG